MSRKQDQPYRRRATTPTLAALEDRRLMTRGLLPAPMPAPFQVPQGGAAGAASVAVADARLADGAGAASVSTLPAFDVTSTKDWIYSGSDARFGPGNFYILSGGNAWPSSSTAPGTPADASPSQAKLDAAFAKQSADIQAVQDKSEVTPRLLAALRTAREKVASEAGTADAALIKTLQDGVQAVQQSGTFTDAQQAQIKADYTAALKGAGVSDATIAGLFAAEDAVWDASHVTADDLKTLADDQAAVQALIDAMPKGEPALYTTDIAASSRGPAAVGGVTAYATASETTTSVAATTSAAAPSTAAAPGAKAAAASSVTGALPQGIQTPGREIMTVATNPTTVAMRPSGFDPSVQFARLSRRTATSGAGSLRGATAGTRVLNGRAAVLNTQAVPASVARRLPALRGMRTDSQP